MIDNGGNNRIQRGSESWRVNHPQPRLGPASPESLSGASAPGPTSTGVKSVPTETPSLPNWESVRDRYLTSVELFGRDPISARDLALARLGAGVSAPALHAESTALYNLLQAAAMYGLVEWLGGDRFAVRILPDADRLEWDDSFYARAELLRGKVARSPTDKELARDCKEDGLLCVLLSSPVPPFEKVRRSLDL